MPLQDYVIPLKVPKYFERIKIQIYVDFIPVPFKFVFNFLSDPFWLKIPSNSFDSFQIIGFNTPPFMLAVRRM